MSHGMWKNYMTDNNEYTQKLAIFLHKETVKEYEQCIKDSAIEESKIYDVKEAIGLSGKIFLYNTIYKFPSWRDSLLKLAEEETVGIGKNASNKAAVVFKHEGRFFSITFGYGKSMLDDTTITRNFGLFVSANLVDPSKIRSLNSMMIEDTLVATQKQAMTLTTQENLQVDPEKEILKSISGSPEQESTAKFLVGTDSLIATKKMKIEDIKESIVFFYSKYKDTKYKENGFGWLDNIHQENDKAVKASLDKKLSEDILDSEKNIVIGPNHVLNWEDINGFYFSGMQNKCPVSIDLEYELYLNYIQTHKNNIKNSSFAHVK
ncbi:hypothetical protein C7K43_11625 [Tetragenococcus koreensis]|nr:hypothetical protein C7K43_11625 [Tetragenococcus koreensis]